MLFSIYLSPRTSPVGPAGPLDRRALDQAVRGEQLGYDAIWVDDGYDRRADERLIVLGAIAARLSSLPIGLAVWSRSGGRVPPEAAETTRLLRHRQVLSAITGRPASLGVWTGSGHDVAHWAAEHDAVLLCSSPQDLLRAREYLEGTLVEGRRDRSAAGRCGLYCPVLPTETDDAARQLLRSTIDPRFVRLPSDDLELAERFGARPETMLTGSSDTIMERLQALRARVGEDFQVVLDFSVREHLDEQIMGSMERFSREVLPLFRPQPFIPPTLA